MGVEGRCGVGAGGARRAGRVAFRARRVDACQVVGAWPSEGCADGEPPVRRLRKAGDQETSADVELSPLHLKGRPVVRTVLVVATALLAALSPACVGGDGTAASTGYTTVPNVAPDYPGKATSEIRAAHLVAVVPSLPSVRRGGPGGNGYAVISQKPSPGTRVPVGSTVTLRLGLSANGGGPWTFAARVEMPDVEGRSVETAYRLAADAGLSVTLRAFELPLHRMAVRSQSLPAGQVVDKGTEIVLTLG